MMITPFRAQLPAPVTTSFGVVHERRGFYVDEGGVRGEATPLPAFGTETLEDCERALRGDDVAVAPCARHALEQLRLSSSGDPLRALAAHAGVVPVADITCHTLCPFDIDVVAAAVEAGVGTIKLKVDEAEHTRHFVRRLRARFPTSVVKLRLDANGSLDEISARWLLRSLRDDDGVELIEQPVAAADVDALVALATDFTIPVCADEALIDPARRAFLLAHDAPLGFIWHPQAVGGATVVIDAVKRLPNRIHVVSGFFDTHVAASYARACARVVDAITGTPRAHGLALEATLVS